MKTVETDYFVSRLLSLEETILNLSSFGCIFTFPFWILGTYFIYTTMCKVNKIWGIERSGFFNGRGKWAKDFDNQRV